MKSGCIIPARMASTRFPGKPMAIICGIPMIGHVYYRAKLAMDNVYIATCDKEIADYIEFIGGEAVMTPHKYETCIDRCGEANETLKLNKIVIVQGDEPLIEPETISFVENKINHSIINLMADIKTIEEWENPNTIKVVINGRNKPLYFSREPIPSNKKCVGMVKAKKQVCVFGFNNYALSTFCKLERSLLEKIEAIDMIRAIENGLKIIMLDTKKESIAVDIPEDIQKVKQKLLTDYTYMEYCEEGIYRHATYIRDRI